MIGMTINRRLALKRCLSGGTKAVFACVAITAGATMVSTEAHAGGGSCSKCACREFNADYRNDRICGNCGHTYYDHW